MEAPSILGLFPRGVETLPDALLKAGLSGRLRAEHRGRVEPPPYDDRRDPDTLLLNPHGIANYSIALANAVAPLLDEGLFPVVLGGDCSILIGTTLALRRRDRYGLLFLDGHADFYQPEAEPAGEAASMDLALVTGHGPTILTDLEGRSPLVREDDVVAIGRRDGAETEEHGSQRIEESAIDVIDLATLRKLGAEAVSGRAIQHLSRRDLDGFWIHLDADVLDDAIMPAVDYRMPGGLSREELTTILRASMASDRAIGIQLTILNPKLDQGGAATRTFVEVVADGLSQPCGEE